MVIITPFMIAVFYTVITVWIFGYLFHITTGDLALLAQPDTFGTFINSNSVFVYLAVVTALVYLILLGGVQQGIEKAAKILMPTLFFMLVGMVVFVLTLDNAMAGVEYYLVPDFSKITAATVNSALSCLLFFIAGYAIMITMVLT